MEPISTITERLIKSWQSSAGAQGQALQKCLEATLNKQELKHLTYILPQKPEVVLGVDSCAWLYILNLKKRQLLKSFNQTLMPGENITKITLRLDTRNNKRKGI